MINGDCSVIIEHKVSLFVSLLFSSSTGRCNLHDQPLEPSVLYDLLYSYHGECCVVLGQTCKCDRAHVTFCLLQVVMTIIVAFILDAFVFRMNYSRRNREPLENPEGKTKCVFGCMYRFIECGQWIIETCAFVHAPDENGIVFEVEVSRDEALATLELYKQMCPGQSSLSSLQRVLHAMDRSGVGTYSNRQDLLFTCCLTVSHTCCCCVCSTPLWFTWGADPEPRVT